MSTKPWKGTRRVARTFHIQTYSSSLGGNTFFFSPPEACPAPVSSSRSAPSSAIGSSLSSDGCSSPVFSGCSSSNTSNSRSFLTSPKFLTAGRPFLKERSLSVNRGPISCNWTFSTERNAYLPTSKDQNKDRRCREKRQTDVV